MIPSSTQRADIDKLFRDRCVNAVCFDVDSTVSPHEGIDEFAKFLGVGDQVAEVTKMAMEGKLDFRQALQQRLDVMKITKESIASFLQANPPQLTPGIKTLVSLLESVNIKVFLVSGGFRSFIEPLMFELGLNPEERLFANTFVFDEVKQVSEETSSTEGTEQQYAFARFDPNEPTSESGGKARALQTIITNHFSAPSTSNPDIIQSQCVIMVGDGATDLEAKPPAAGVIGYGGVTARDVVREKSDLFIYDFEELISIVRSSHT